MSEKKCFSILINPSRNWVNFSNLPLPIPTQLRGLDLSKDVKLYRNLQYVVSVAYNISGLAHLCLIRIDYSIIKLKLLEISHDMCKNFSWVYTVYAF